MNFVDQSTCLDAFMFEGRIFSFRLLSDANQVDVVMAAFDARQRLDVNDIRKKIETSPKLHVQRL